MSRQDERPRGLGKRAWLTTRLLRRIARFLAFIRFVDVTVINREAVPKKGAAIVACNHISISDPVFLWGALRRRAIAIAMAELWENPLIGWLMKLLGHIPVKRGNSDSGTQAIDLAVRVVEHGGLVLIYPSGKCAGPNERPEYKIGVALLAFATSAPVYPAGIVGSNNVMPLARHRAGGKRFRRDQKVRIVFGEPLKPADFQGPRELLAQLQRDIEDLARPGSAGNG